MIFHTLLRTHSTPLCKCWRIPTYQAREPVAPLFNTTTLPHLPPTPFPPSPILKRTAPVRRTKGWAVHHISSQLSVVLFALLTCGSFTLRADWWVWLLRQRARSHLTPVNTSTTGPGPLRAGQCDRHPHVPHSTPFVPCPVAAAWLVLRLHISSCGAPLFRVIESSEPLIKDWSVRYYEHLRGFELFWTMAVVRAVTGRGGGGRFLLGYIIQVLFCCRLFPLRDSENPHGADNTHAR